MPATITVNWRAVKRLALVLVCITLPVLYYLYHTFKPPVALYTDLFASEVELSKTVIQTQGKDRYVKFRQLQGAGFNNQVRHRSGLKVVESGLICVVLGPRNTTVPSPGSADLESVCIPAAHMASTWRESNGSTLSFPSRSD